MKRILILIICLLGYGAQAQVLNVNNVWVTGHFNGCQGNNTPNVSLSFVSGNGSVFSNGGIMCTDPCGTTTIKVTISGIKWKKDPGDQWLHGIFLPANSGYTVSGIILPTGFSTYNGGCTGACPGGILTGPGFYYDAYAGPTSCCGNATANDGTPCNNYGQTALDCPGTFGMQFNLTFCNSSIVSTTDTFTLTGTGDGLTGCWGNPVGATTLNTINFTVPTFACGPVTSVPFVASPVVKDCSGGLVNYTSTLSGGCSSGNTVTWWTAATGGTQVGTGSPFVYDPAGSACPAGTTLYASCCAGGSSTCISRTAVTIPGTCDPPISISAATSQSGDCITPSQITSITVQNNLGPVTYTLNPGNVINSTGIFTGLTQSSYTVVASDGSNCTASTVFSFTPIILPAMTITSGSILCSGDTTFLTATALGSVTPYSYSLNGGPLGASGTFYGLPAGTYTVSLTDGNACVGTSTYQITEPSPLAISFSNTPILCYGDSTVLTINASGGTSGYEYSLNGSAWQSSSIFNFITSGNYTVSVKDANGCTASTVITIGQPSLLSATVSTTPILCFNGKSTVTITASGGTLPSYQYNLSGAGYQTYNIYNNVSAGTYTVQVYDGNNCTFNTVITITQPPALALSASHTPILCNAQTSTLTVTASGGTGAIEYSLNGSAYQASNIFSPLNAGTYTITVKDDNGCTKTLVHTISEPLPLTVSCANDTVTCAGNQGSLIAVAAGGTTNYGFSLNGSPSQSSGNFNGLTAGIYTIEVTDANGCTVSVTALVVEPSPLTLIAQYNPILCFGETTDIIMTATGGNTLSYVYSLNGGASQASNTFPAQPAGSYTCSVSDASGCTASTTIIITQPPLLEVQALTNSILCYGGTAIVSAIGTGGTGSLQYSLNGGAYQASTNFPGQPAGTYTITVVDANNCTATSTVLVTQPTQLVATASSSVISCSGLLSTITVTATGGTVPVYQYSLNGGANQLSNIFSGVSFGTYTVQVLDGNNCSATTLLTIAQPSPLTLSLSANPILCFAGTTTLVCNASGGTPSYQYSINGGPFQTSSSFNNIPNGNYTVVVSDANNCTESAVIAISQPGALSVTASATTILCFGNTTTITALASGGTAPSYSYSLNGGAQQASNNFTNIAAGNYTVTVFDANNCSATTTLSITQPTQLQLSATASSIACNGGSATITALGSGGTTPSYSYQVNGGPWQSSGIFNGLLSGTYTVVVQDANNCIATSVVIINQPTPLSVSLNAASISCFGGTTTLIATASGGTTPSYQYSLNGGAFQSSNQFALTPAGFYTLTVMDANNCTATSVISITQPLQLSVSGNAASIACFNGTTTLVATASGGVPTYEYNLNGGAWQIANTFAGVTSGTYTLNVKDGNNCTASTVLNITQPSQLTLLVTAAPILCNGGSTSIVANPGGGTVPAYQYNSNGGAWQPSNLFPLVFAGTYTITVQDGNGCTATSSIIITEPPVLTINGITATTPSCIPGNDAVLTVNASGGSPILTYSINGSVPQTSNVFNGLGVAVYTVMVTDANACSATGTYAITNPNSPVITNTSIQDAICFGGNTGSLSVTATGTSALTYTLLPNTISNTTGSFANLTAGSYTVSVSDASLCSASTVLVVSQPPALQWNVVNVQPVTCNNATDGSITLNASGGTGTINYTLLPSNVTNTSGSFTNLTSGTYTVQLSDANACTASTVCIVTNPLPITLTSLLFTPETCNNAGDGTITMLCSGGTGTLTYTLNPGSISNTTGNFTNLTGAIYTIVVTDINNCSYQTQLEILNPAPMVFSSLTHTDILCVGNTNGTITAVASGGSSSSYTYTLQPGAIVNSTGLFTGLGMNTYTITAADVNGCTVTATQSIITPSPLFFTVDSIFSVSCYNGTNGAFYTTASGGTAPYTFTLLPGSSPDSIGDYTNLQNGLYSVVVVDANGCSLTVGPVLINQPSPIQLNLVSQQNISCFGLSDGSFTIAASGGTGGLVSSLQPNIGTFTPPGTFSNLSAANYMVTLTDANSCTMSLMVSITQNPPVQFDSVILTPPSCYGDMNGTIAIYGSGGSGNLTYQLNNFSSSTTGFYNNLIQGIYTLSVLDDKGCIKDTVVNLIQPNPLTLASLQVFPVDCDENINGKIIAVAAGGVAGYTYILRPQIKVNQTGVFIHLKANTYTLTIRDANGCEIDTLITILPPDKYMEITMDTKDNGCFGYGKEGEATANVVNGTPPYTYTWSSVPPQYNQTATGLKFGYYFVEVIDARGCIRKDTVYIKPGTCCEEIFIPNAFSPNGDGMNDEFRITTSTGLEVIDFAVYNRWGVKVWSSYDMYRGWDGSYQGQLQDMGTYYYLFKYKCLYDGNTYIKKGDVILVQ